MRIRLCALLLMGVLGSVPAEAQFTVPEPAPGEAFTLELGAAFWSPAPELLVQTGALAQIGESEVDLVREFAIEEDRFRDLRVVLKPGRKHKIRFSYLRMAYDEEAVLERTIAFGGQTFPISAAATADLEWQLWRFGYEWDFIAGDRGLLGLVVDLKYNRIRAELAAEGFGTETTEAQAPVPTIGVIARVYPHRTFSLTAEYTGFKMPGFIGDRIEDSLAEDDFDATLSDFDVYGTLNFGRHVGIQGGYRSLTAEYLVDEDSGDLTMKGMYWGVLLRF